MLKLQSIEDALAFVVQQAGDGEPKFEGVEIAGDWAALDIKITGKNYHGTVPGNLARGLWELQQELYRAVAFAKYGVDDMRRIPKQELEQYTLVFKVEEGSSWLTAPIDKFLETLSNAIAGMTSEEKAKLVVKIGLIIATTWGATSLSNQYFDYRTKTEVAAKQLQVDAQRLEIEKARIEADVRRNSELAELILALAANNPPPSRLRDATPEGAKAVVKNAADADEIRIGQAKFDRTQINEITQRADRESPESVGISGEFRITGFKRAVGSDVARFLLTNEAGELSVIMDLADTDSFTQEQLRRFWVAVETGAPIELGVQKRVVGDKVKHAWVESILDAKADVAVVAR